MRLTRVTPPATALVSLAQVYSHLRLDPVGSPPSHPDDALLETYIGAAVDHLDGFSGVLGRCLVTQTWRADAAYPDYYGRFEIPMPVAGVTSVEVLKDDAYAAVSPSLYTFRSMGAYGIVRPRNGMSWPHHDHDEAAFRITFTAGYGDPEDVPSALVTAALLLVGGWYENREAIATGGFPQKLPGGVDTLIAPYRIAPNG
jgi:uncharacterized phiE125 gp8 family phage protein